MFKNNKYKKWYFNLIKSRKNIKRKDFTEKHHIIPKCLGGKNSPENIVRLTPREHFIAHLLLTKMSKNKNIKKKMYYALMEMKRINSEGKCRVSSKVFEKHRKRMSYMISGKNNPFYGKGHFGENNPIKKEKNYKKFLKAVQSEEHRNKMSLMVMGEKNPFYGKKHSEETIKKLSELASKRIGEKSPMFGKKHKIVECEFCFKKITYPMYRRWHGENCKKYKKN